MVDNFFKYPQRTQTDCSRCCVAGILKHPYENVPDFWSYKGAWINKLQEYVFDTTGQLLITTVWPLYGLGLKILYTPEFKDTEYYAHCVISFGSDVVYDPSDYSPVKRQQAKKLMLQQTNQSWEKDIDIMRNNISNIYEKRTLCYHYFVNGVY